MRKVIVLTGPWSHECADVKAFWEAFRKRVPIDLNIIDVETEQGAKLMDEYEISSVPATIINSEVEFIGMPDIKRVEEIFEI